MDRVRLILFSVFYPLFGVTIESLLVGIGFPIALVPDLVFILILFYSFYAISVFGAALVFLVGLVVDISGGMLLGPWAGAYILCFGIVSMVSDRIFVESYVSLFSLTLVFVAVSHFIFLFIAFDPLSQLSTEWLSILGKSFVSALVAPYIFPFLRRMLELEKGESNRVARMQYR